MDEIIAFLLSQIESKLDDKGISEKAHAVLSNIKLELNEMANGTWTVEDAPKLNKQLDSMNERLKKLKETDV